MTAEDVGEDKEFREFKEYRERAQSSNLPELPLPNFPNYLNLPPRPNFLSEWCGSGASQKRPPRDSTE